MDTPINPQQLMTIPRVIEAILAIMIIWTLSLKFKSIPIKQRPLLHQLFIFGFTGWLIYVLCDIFVYGFAAASFNKTQSIEAIGYDSRYPSLLIGNILRDIGIFGSFLQIFAYYFAANAIFFGETKTRNQIRNKPLIILMITVALLVAAIDQVRVLIQDRIILIGTIGSSITDFIQLIIPILLYNLAAWRLSQILKKTDESDHSEYTSKITNLRLGMAIMGFSYIFYILIRLLGAIFDFYDNIIAYITFNFIIHAFWIISPIMIYRGVKNLNNQPSESKKV